MDHRKAHDRDADEGGDENGKAPDQIARHGLLPSLQGSIFLQALGHVPLLNVVGNARRGRDDPLDAGAHRRQAVGYIEEDVRLLIRKDLLEAVVTLLALCLIIGLPAVFKQLVHLRVLVVHEVEAAFYCLA